MSQASPSESSLLPESGTVYIVGGQAKDGEKIAKTLKSRTSLNFQVVKSLPDSLPEDFCGMILIHSTEHASDSFFHVKRSVRTQMKASLVDGPFHSLRQALPALESKSSSFVAAVSFAGGQFNLDGTQEHNPLLGVLPGLIKTAAKEHANIRFRLVDFHIKENWIPLFADEILFYNDDIQTGILDGKRYIQQPCRTYWNQEKSDFSLTSEDVILVTGGARGVTAETIRQMAAVYPCHYLLAGRSSMNVEYVELFSPGDDETQIRNTLIRNWKEQGKAFTPKDLQSHCKSILAALEVQYQLNYLKQLGAKAQYLQLDVTDEAATSKTLKSLQSETGPITGVIHGAGVIRDKLISEKTDEQFHQVFTTKIDSLALILDCLNKNPLKLMAFFSSVAGKFGNKGQCDYAAANETMNYLSLQGDHRWPECRFLSFCWGPFEGGMVTPQLAAMFKSQGIGLIPVPTGASLFVEELLSGNYNRREITVGVGSIELGQTHTYPRPDAWIIPWKLDLKNSPYLQDHKLKDEPVLPMAMVVEWCADIAGTIYPGARFSEIQNLKVHNGISFHEDSMITTIHANVIESPANAPLALHLEIKSAAKENLVHYSADVILEQWSSKPSSMLKKAEKTELTPSVKDAYHNFLFHGKSLSKITEISGLQDDAITGIVKTSPASTLKLDKKMWITEPLALDCMAQMGLVWLGTLHKNIGIPQSMKSFKMFKPIPAESDLECRAVLESLNKTTCKASMKFQFILNNQIVAEGNGWEAIFHESFNQYTTRAKEENA